VDGGHADVTPAKPLETTRTVISPSHSSSGA
jgi:hypothetical protein